MIYFNGVLKSCLGQNTSLEVIFPFIVYTGSINNTIVFVTCDTKFTFLMALFNKVISK